MKIIRALIFSMGHLPLSKWDSESSIGACAKFLLYVDGHGTVHEELVDLVSLLCSLILPFNRYKLFIFWRETSSRGEGTHPHEAKEN
jgi:hypothetical protein